MLSIFKILSLANLVFTPAMADVNKVGNGGNVVQCKIDGKASSELLDFYEADLKTKLEGASVVEVATQALDKIKHVAPKLYAQYVKRLNTIQSEIVYRDDIQIVDVPDSKHLFKPLQKGCEVLQIAVRDNGSVDPKKRFLIRKDLWKELSVAQQAGLLTHEIIHEHFTKLGEENSIKARKVNAFIYDDSKKADDFWKFVADLRVPIYP